MCYSNGMKKLSEKTYTERFWEKVDVPEQKDGRCWLWTAGKNRDGYGVFPDGMKLVGERRAHRISYALHYGIIEDRSLFVCHACDTPSCVNPNHLWLGTNSENMEDMHRKSRRPAVEQSCKFDRIPEEVRDHIRSLRDSGKNYSNIARTVGLSVYHVKRVLGASEILGKN